VRAAFLRIGAEYDHLAMQADESAALDAKLEAATRQLSTASCVGPIDAATMAIAKKAASLTKEGKLKSVAGGRDTVTALSEANVADDFTYVSAAGGAFVEWMEGKALPAVETLRARRMGRSPP
jgi:phosphoglycerate kinase